MKHLLRNDIIFFLKQRLGFFHSEREIQVLLAKYLMDTRNYSEVYIEYCINKELLNDYPWRNDKKISIDIVARRNDEYLPVEIKFRTKKQNFPYHIFGSSEKSVQLAEQSAKDEGCYGFWKDVKRNEVLKQSFKLKDCGLTLFITNDHNYLKKPNEGSMYGPFSIHESRKVTAGTKLDWDVGRKSMKDHRSIKFPPISLENDYFITWDDVSIKNHKFLLT